MATLHIENTVRDLESWKAVFDKYERLRIENRMRAYRVARHVAEPNRVTIDMDFDSVEDASSFRSALQKIWQTPQSQGQLVSHDTPELLDLVEQRTL